MSWISRKLTDSDYAYPVDYDAYFQKRVIQKNMDEWYQKQLLMEQARERNEIWNQYMEAKKKNG